MTVQPGWGYPPAAAGGSRADLDQVLRTLPPKEQRQFANYVERLALQHVAGAAGSETIWGVASCRTDVGAGVISLTDDHVFVTVLNAQHQLWHTSIALADITALEYDEGGPGLPGCVASLAFGQGTIIGLTVGRDTEYATAFLRMINNEIVADYPEERPTGASAPGADVLAAFVRDGLQRRYPDRWTDWLPGVACSLVSQGVGMLVRHDEGKIRIVAHALSHLALGPELIADLAQTNEQIPFGAFHLRRGESPDDWQLVYGYTVLAQWVDPAAGVSVQLLQDLLEQIPGIVEWEAGRLATAHGGVRPPVEPDPGWQNTTMVLG